MVSLNVGNRWEEKFLDKVIELNERYKKNRIRVTELYGNDTNACLPGVRPEERLKNFGQPPSLEKYIQRAKENGIDINYTFNLSCIGNLIRRDTGNQHENIQIEIEILENLGVKRFTIYSPYILTHYKFKSQLEVSTIHNNTNINYILGTASLNRNIDKVCLPIYLNRNFKRLQNLVPILKNMSISPELILNEFCTSYQSACMYRSECYNLQSHGHNIKYPFSVCSKARKDNPSLWLKAPFILPQWLEFYEEQGMTNFKLTGRTLPTENILRVLEYYMKRYCNIPLEQLWGAALPYNVLENKEKVMTGDIGLGFLKSFMKEDCESLHCGYECTRCDDVWNNLKTL